MSTKAIIGSLSKEYANPMCKLGRLVKEGKYTPIIRGSYETDPNTSGYLLSTIYSPSYLSFEYALSRYGLIPEAVFEYTSASYGKNRTKEYRTSFGVFTYRDVPKNVFPIGVRLIEEGDYCYWMATPEKALCDQLYSMKPIEGKRYLEEILFDDLRLYAKGLDEMDVSMISRLSKGYRCKNVSYLDDYLRSRR